MVVDDYKHWIRIENSSISPDNQCTGWGLSQIDIWMNSYAIYELTIGMNIIVM